MFEMCLRLCSEAEESLFSVHTSAQALQVCVFYHGNESAFLARQFLDLGVFIRLEQTVEVQFINFDSVSHIQSRCCFAVLTPANKIQKWKAHRKQFTC